MGFPTVIASSVIRSSQQGQSHGGVYLVDLETQERKQVIDWNDPDISWEGRGWGRGLRGIAFYNDRIYLAAGDELFVFTPQFERIGSYRNPYLKHCHEIMVDGNWLYLTSTGFNTLLVFNLSHNKFIEGIHLKFEAHDRVGITRFDPNTDQGPEEIRDCHINSVWVEQGRLYACGTLLNALFVIGADKAEVYATVPLTTHDARPYQGGVLCHDTAKDQVAILSREGVIEEAFPLVRYPESTLTWTELTEDMARQAFGRGLCVTDDGLIIAGSSPSTIAVYQRGQRDPLRYVQLTNDIRNAVHGLEIWPFEY